jgi:hypothetical protein
VLVQLSPGQQLGAYTLVEQVGRGGMGVVYKAYQSSLARFVAVKVLPDELAADPAFRTRFKEEAISIAGLRHPNILAVFDYGEVDGGAYIVAEFIDGGTLAQQLGTPLPAHYSADILRPIGAALDYAHARGVIHRDVKPGNILLNRDGTPMLSDFGLARMLAPDRDITTTGLILGTPDYMAPEQALGEPVPASDQYALGIVAYEMLTGRVPYSAPTPIAVVLAHQTQELPPPRSVNPDITIEAEAAVVKALSRDPAARFRSATDFARALGEQTPSAGIAAVPPGQTSGGGEGLAGSGAGRRWWIAGVAVLALAAVAVGGWFAYRALAGRSGPAAPPPPATAKTVTWQQWKKIPGIFDAQPTSSGGLMTLAQNRLLLIDRGQASPFAQGQGGFEATGNEPYIATSPGLHLNACDFVKDETFALHQGQPLTISRVDGHGHASQLAALGGLPDLNGIVFDTGGKFGKRLLLVSDGQNSAAVTAVDCQGNAARIAASVPKVEGGLAIAPDGFGSFGGDLVAPDEFDGKIYAVDPSGQPHVVADSGLPSGQDVGVESAGFVPAGFMASDGAVYVADRATPNNVHPGTDTLLRLTVSDLKSAGVQDGDLLVVTEGGGKTLDVQCSPGCSVHQIGNASPGAHIEGHLAFTTTAQ